MTFVRLIHNAKLRAPEIHADAVGGGADRTLLSFRRNGTPDRTVVVDATIRLNVFEDVRHLVLDHIEEDSDLALPILSDVLHSLPVGATVEHLGDPARSILRRGYFADSFETTGAEGDRIFFRKCAPCMTEAEPGLTDWSFCIPVGPGDATQLNYLVERILSFTDLNLEILLSGTPGETFRYGDQVRIVPERRETDQVGDGINICTKKNILVEHARHANVCVLHDRVLLPHGFGAIMRRHGEIYAMHTLQCLYFDDYRNMAPIRYSDVNTAVNQSAFLGPVGLTKDGKTLSVYSPSTVWQLMRDGDFKYQHAMKYNQSTYSNGSLYICKRKLWSAHPQDERINWGECEDVEHGLRLMANGVPARVNHHGLTQSVNLRATIVGFGEVQTVSVSGRIRRMHIPLPVWTERKPFYRLCQSEALLGLQSLADRYGFSEYELPTVKPSVTLTSNRWMQEVFKVSNGIRVRNERHEIRRFVLDWLKTVHGDTSNLAANEIYLEQIDFHGKGGLNEFLKLSHWSRILMLFRPNRSVFRASHRDFLVSDGLTLRVGSMISALRLWTRRDRYLYLAGGPLDYYRAIIASTPLKTSK